MADGYWDGTRWDEYDHEEHDDLTNYCGTCDSSPCRSPYHCSEKYEREVRAVMERVVAEGSR